LEKVAKASFAEMFGKSSVLY